MPIDIIGLIGIPIIPIIGCEKDASRRPDRGWRTNHAQHTEFIECRRWWGFRI
jgi:hypothetical protein